VFGPYAADGICPGVKLVQVDPVLHGLLIDVALAVIHFPDRVLIAIQVDHWIDAWIGTG